MVAHEKRNSAQLFCAVPTQNDLALSSLLFSAHPTQKLGYPAFSLDFLPILAGKPPINQQSVAFFGASVTMSVR